MAQNSKIEWCDHTVNLWWGCTKVHAGCDHCYAEMLSHRWGQNVWGNDAPRRIIKNSFSDLQKYQKLAAAAVEIHRVFVGSMMDIFEKPMPLVDSEGTLLSLNNTGDLRDVLFAEINAGFYPNLMFLFLTKRPSNIIKYIPSWWVTEQMPDNVMFGTSPATQDTADNLIKHLIEVPGKHFLSVEPQLEEITLSAWLDTGLIDWVIQGGESGGHKRPFDLEWGRKLRDECYQAKVPYFFKQVDKVQPIPNDLMIREFPAYKSSLV
jgi:protein gp37